MSQPVVATVVASGSFTRLSPIERHYVRSMRKRDRTGVLRILDNDARRQPGMDVPLRIKVLQSALSEEKRMEIFEDLRTCASDKYITWVRRALTIPLGVRHVPTYNWLARSVRARAATTIMNNEVAGYEDVKTELKMSVKP